MRHTLDQYFTVERGVTCAVLDRHPWLAQGRVLEPCAGKGHMANVLREYGADVVTGDIDPAMRCDHTWDFRLAVARTRWGLTTETAGFDAVVSNPPFSISSRAVSDALEVSPRVALLLRASWSEPTKDRRAIWAITPPQFVHPLNPRPKFRTDRKGSDTATCAWFVWDGSWSGDTKIEPFTDWRQA